MIGLCEASNECLPTQPHALLAFTYVCSAFTTIWVHVLGCVRLREVTLSVGLLITYTVSILI